MSSALLPLVPLYAAGVGLKNAAWNRGWLRPKRLRNPVVSIGNLSVGGSGKTPLVIRLAHLLADRGLAVDVLSRGYGRQFSHGQRVEADGSAQQFGDEPLLIARSAGVPVFVGADRYAAGMLAEAQQDGPLVHLLDDGFQHRHLGRDAEIVVLHRSDFSSRILPAGRLREPLSSLRRANFMVLRQEDRDLEPELHRRGLPQPIWWMERRLEVPASGRVVAFCAIARPDEFQAGLQSQGVAVAAMRAWRDHHRFVSADLAELIELRRQHEAEAFVTTEKDLVRLSPQQQRMLGAAAPLRAARLMVRLQCESAVTDALLALLASSGSLRAP